MSTILDELKSKKSRKMSIIKAKVDSDFKDKIDFICSKSDVKSEDYLGQILEKSEINKVYNRLLKEIKEDEKVSESSETNRYE